LLAGVTPGGPLADAVALTGLSLLLASGATCQPLAPALLTAGEVRADLDAGRAQMAVDDDPLARLEAPQLLHRDQGPITGRLGGGDAAAWVGRVVGLGDRLIPISREPSSNAPTSASPERKTLARWPLRMVAARSP
jgi:hypothetical protein